MNGHAFHGQVGGLTALEATPSSQVTSVVEHVVTLRIEGPVGPFSRLLVVACLFDEAVVEREIVPYAVLPALLVFPIEGKLVHDVLVDAVQGDLLLRRCLDCHRDEGDIRVRRFDHLSGRRMSCRRTRDIEAAAGRLCLVVGRESRDAGKCP